jgi:hypothetical protein
MEDILSIPLLEALTLIIGT